MNEREIFRYPEEIKPQFLQTSDLVFGDQSHVTAEEIWRYMTIDAPRRYPFAFAKDPSFGRQLSQDVTFMSGIRNNYLGLTAIDRVRAFVRKGKPLVLVQGGIPTDLYYATGCIPVGPMFLRGWIVNRQEGRGFREANAIGASLLEKARRSISFECCNLISYLGLLKTEDLPIAAVAPCITSRCSDMAYAVEDYRAGTDAIPTYIMDYPSNYEGGNERVAYLKEEIRTVMQHLAEISGEDLTDERFRDEIRRQNKARRLARECQKIWWKAKTPPTNSSDCSFSHLALMGAFDLPVATQVLAETRDEIQKRAIDGIAGTGLTDDPARIYICGSCAHANANFIDRKGGVIVGNEDIWSSVSVEVKESGDPYENLAVALSDLPYERSTEERAEWTIQQLKDARADGVLFMFNWGCNYQSAVARMVTDTIREETGLPAMSIEVGELTRMESIEQSQNRVESFIEMLR